MNIYFFIIPLIITTSFYHFFIKLSSNLINPVLGALILALSAILISSSVLVYNNYMLDTQAKMLITNTGILYSVLSGLSIGIFELLMFYAFKEGFDLSVLSPIIISGSVFFTFFIGVLFFKENIDLTNILAITFISIGCYMLIK